jgi:hypothetical protein
MRINRHTIVIDRPREVVFDYAVDCSRATNWRQYVESITPDGPIAPGSTLRAVMNIMGERKTFKMTVLAFRRPEVWRHMTDEIDLAGYVEYRFDPEAAGTRVTLTMEAKPISIYGWLAIPILWLRRQRSYVDQLPQLKRAVERDVPLQPAV